MGHLQEIVGLYLVFGSVSGVTKLGIHVADDGDFPGGHSVGRIAGCRAWAGGGGRLSPLQLHNVQTLAHTILLTISDPWFLTEFTKVDTS